MGKADQRPQLQTALDLLASGTVESICLTTPQMLARTEDDIANLKSFLSEHDIGLTLESAVVSLNTTHGGQEAEGPHASSPEEVKDLDAS